MKSTSLFTILIIALMGIGHASTVEQSHPFTFGGDVRARYDFTDHMPKGMRESPYADYARLRTRVYGQYHQGDFKLYLRLANEFRWYRSPTSSRDKQAFPDVFFVDNFYWEQKNILDGIDLKVGRQEIKLGAGRIFSDGTGGDGSRSNYFDAVRGTWHYGRESSIEALTLYVGEDDWLPTLGKKKDEDGEYSDYDPTGFGGNSEFGAGLYWQHREKEDLPFDGYVVYKHETTGSKIMGRDLYTVGFRLMPQFTETISGEVEVAAQYGERDDGKRLSGEMVYGGIDWDPQRDLFSQMTLACLYLSGGDDNTGWDPVFSRSTGIGELIAPMYTAYRYTNLVYPHVRLSFIPIDAHTFDVETGPMYTAIDEEGSGGRYKGFYNKAKYSFPVAQDIQATITFEYLIKGDYFEEDSRDNAWFTRFELVMTF